jgi:hypothetical protein
METLELPFRLPCVLHVEEKKRRRSPAREKAINQRTATAE